MTFVLTSASVPLATTVTFLLVWRYSSTDEDRTVKTPSCILFDPLCVLLVLVVTEVFARSIIPARMIACLESIDTETLERQQDVYYEFSDSQPEKLAE